MNGHATMRPGHVNRDAPVKSAAFLSGAIAVLALVAAGVGLLWSGGEGPATVTPGGRVDDEVTLPGLR